MPDGRPPLLVLTLAGALLSCAARPGPPIPATAQPAVPPAPPVETLPRFQQLWSRDGLGRYDGTTQDGVYYTVANDRLSIHAVDVQTGKSVWQAPLTIPADVNFDIEGTKLAVVLVYQRRDAAEAVVVRLSAQDGTRLWRAETICPEARGEGVGSRFYLECGSHMADPHEVRELDLATGRELGRVSITGSYHLTADGICGMSRSETWCGRLAGSRIERRWTEPAGSSRFATFLWAGSHLVQTGSDRVVVRRTGDGGIAWERPGPDRYQIFERPARLVFTHEKRLEIVRLEDGAAVVSLDLERQATAYSDGERLLIVPWQKPGRPAYVVDAGGRVQAIDRNLAFIDQATSGVLLSRNVGMSGINTDAAPLEGYSLTSFAPAQTTLDPYHQVVAVLERHRILYDTQMALAALRALRSIPDATESLARVIRSGPPALLGTALALANLTADLRFVAPIRERLEAVTSPPEGRPEWAALIELVTVLSALRSPESPEALLAFWNRMGAKLSPARPRRLVEDAVASAIWSYGARKEWVSCPDTTFPVVGAPPDQAALGTTSPGLPYAFDGHRRWAVVCEARTDDDGDGEIEVFLRRHGNTVGDELRPYLVLGSGAGQEIGDLVAVDRTSRWAVLTKDMCVHLVDLRTGKAKALVGADGRPGDPVGGAHRAASFSVDGGRLLYLKSDGGRSRVIERDLRTSQERTIDPGAVELSQVFFEAQGRFVVMEVVVKDTSGDGLVRPPRLATTLGPRRCRGPVLAASFFGHVDDRPIQLVAPATGEARVSLAPEGMRYHPPTHPVPGYELVAPGDAGIEPHAPLPRGPFRWRARREAR